MLLFNQVPGFFYDQYPWNESILDFLYGEIHQQKLASEVVAFGL